MPFPLPYELDSLDVVESAYHPAYEQEGEKFFFNPDKYAEIKAAGLKKNQADLHKEKAALKRELDTMRKQFDGLTPDEIAAMRARKDAALLDGDDSESGQKPPADKSAEELRLKYQAQLKAEREKLSAEKEREVTEREKRIQELETKYKQARLRGGLETMALEAGVYKTDLDTYIDILLMRGLYDLSEDDDGTGKPQLVFIEGGAPSAVSAEQAMRETLREKFPRFYEAEIQGGSGSRGGIGGRPPVDWHKLPPEERIAYGRRFNKARS